MSLAVFASTSERPAAARVTLTCCSGAACHHGNNGSNYGLSFLCFVELFSGFRGSDVCLCVMTERGSEEKTVFSVDHMFVFEC